MPRMEVSVVETPVALDDVLMEESTEKSYTSLQKVLGLLPVFFISR